MAVMASRFADALGLAQEARSEALEVEADEVATRALIFEGMAESGRGSPAGSRTWPGPAARASRPWVRASATRRSR